LYFLIYLRIPNASGKRHKAFGKVYYRHCASFESGEVHIGRIKKLIPSEGHVSILSITDKQFGNIINYWGASTKAMPDTPKQLELF
jgi:CRISPR-associated protein Cas2